MLLTREPADSSMRDDCEIGFESNDVSTRVANLFRISADKFVMFFSIRAHKPHQRLRTRSIHRNHTHE